MTMRMSLRPTMTALSICHLFVILRGDLVNASSPLFPVAFHHGLSTHDTGRGRRPRQTVPAFTRHGSAIDDKDEADIETKWIELMPPKYDDNDDRHENNKKLSRSKIVMFGSFAPLDPFQQAIEDDENENSFLMNVGGVGGKDDEHPLRTHNWEFNLHMFNKILPFAFGQQRRRSSSSSSLCSSGSVFDLNDILWNRQSHHGRLRRSIKIHVELHPSGMCRALVKPINNVNDTVRVDKKGWVWLSLFRTRTMEKKNDPFPVALGSWKSRPWGVIVQLNPLVWNAIGGNNIGGVMVQSVRSKQRRKSGKSPERMARLISSQEYILTAKAFDYDFFGSNPTLSQGTIVWVDKKKEYDKRIQQQETKNKKKAVNNRRRRLPIILERDLYRDVPLVDSRYFSNLGWGKQWFLPVVGTFSASGLVK